MIPQRKWNYYHRKFRDLSALSALVWTEDGRVEKPKRGSVVGPSVSLVVFLLELVGWYSQLAEKEAVHDAVTAKPQMEYLGLRSLRVAPVVMTLALR